MNEPTIMLRLDALVAELEAEGYPLRVILEEMDDYLEIAYELNN